MCPDLFKGINWKKSINQCNPQSIINILRSWVSRNWKMAAKVFSAPFCSVNSKLISGCPVSAS